MPFAAALLAVSLGVAASANRLEGVRVHDAPDYTRVVFDTTNKVSYKLFTLEDPLRVVVDFSSTSAAGSLSTSRLSSDVVKGVRRAARGSGEYRIVLDVDRKVSPKSFTLAPVAPYGHRLVVDLGWDSPKSSLPAARKPRGERDVVVAIDPGHGGDDPGAIGPGRVFEKKVVLSIADAIKRDLDSTRGFRAVLVRSGDYYVSLKRRPNIAREQRADLFVSIHADAFKIPSVRGASVYALSQKRATSETARWLAENENRSDLLGGVGNVSLKDKDDLLAEVLLDLSMAANMSASITAGEAILGSLGGVTKLHKKRVEQAGFVVLKSPDVPSILVETGYLSNPEEARLLSSSNHQAKVAVAIADGIRQFMRRNPPPGSLIAEHRGTTAVKHVVKRGDTISELATRYAVSIGAIRSANGIRGDGIRAGQILIIPSFRS